MIPGPGRSLEQCMWGCLAAPRVADNLCPVFDGPSNLRMFLNGYENWCLTLKEEHMQKEFQNKVLRRIFVPKRDEITVKW
jgi:hypothetical protein